MDSLLLILAIILICGQSFSLKYIKIKSMKSRMLVYTFFAAITALICSVPVLLNGRLEASFITVVSAAVFGLVFMLCILFYNLSINTGPLSYSSFYFSASMIIPTLCGIVFWKEPTTLTTYISLVLFLLAFYLINVKTGEQQKGSRKWFLYCMLSFLTNGTLGVTMKIQADLMNGTQSSEFVMIAFAFATIFYLLAYLVFTNIDKGTNVKEDMKVVKDNKLPLFILAVTSGGGNMLVSYLTGIIPSSYLHPLLQGGVLVVINLFSILIFKEKLSTKGKIGIVCGVIAIILINM